MKILHILSTSKWTGPASYIVDILEYLNRNKIKNLIAIRTIPSGNLRDILINKGINFTEKLKLYKKFNPIFFYQDLKNLQKIIDSINPDIIHTHFTPENILTQLIKNKKFKLIRSIHNTKSTKKRFLSRFVLNRNDFIHTVCNDYKENLIKFNSIAPEKIKIISGWVDPEKFNPEGDLLIKDETVKIGMVARFQPHRGHEYLIKAFKLIANKNVKLILVGRGEYKPEMEKLVNKLNLNNKVVFTGYLKEELPSLLRSLDIFVLLEEGSDGTCRAILEAMATGLPIVSVKKGAIKEAIQENVNGFLISSKSNIDELYRKLKILIENENLRKEFGNNSRKIILKNYMKDKKLKDFLKFYKNVVTEKSL